MAVAELEKVKIDLESDHLALKVIVYLLNMYHGMMLKNFVPDFPKRQIKPIACLVSQNGNMLVVQELLPRFILGKQFPLI